MDLIDYTYENMNSTHLVPSFFETLFESVLNTQNGGIWGISFLLVITMISLLIFKNYGFDRGIMVSSIITWISALLFLKAGWINQFIFVLSCIYVVVGLWMLFAKRSQEEV